MKHLQNAFADLSRLNARAIAALERFRRTEADARVKVQALATEHEPFRLMGPEHHTKVAKDFAGAWRSRRSLAASVARFELERAVSTAAPALEAFIKGRRADVLASVPQALDGLTPDGMVSLALLREMRAGRVALMTVQELRVSYEQALQVGTAAAMVDVDLIEQRIAGGHVAKDEGELPAFNQLRQRVDDVQAGRVPSEVAEFREALDLANHAIGRLERHQVPGRNHLTPADAAIATEELAALEAMA